MNNYHYVFVVTCPSNPGVKSERIYFTVEQPLDSNAREALRKSLTCLVKENYALHLLRTRPTPTAARPVKVFHTLAKAISMLPAVRLYKTTKTIKQVGENITHKGTLLHLPDGITVDHTWSSESPNYYRTNHFISLKPVNKYVSLNLKQIAAWFIEEWNDADRPHLYFGTFMQNHKGVFCGTTNSTLRIEHTTDQIILVEWDVVTPIYEEVEEKIEL